MDYLYPCLLFVWATYIWDTYLQWRQRSVYKIKISDAPSRVKDIMDESTYTKSQLYQLDKSSYSLAQDFYKQVEFLVILAVGGIPWVWNLAGSVIDHYGYSQDYEVLQSVLFICFTEVYGAITGFPWMVYYTFVLEEKHGFNKQTPSFFIKDQIKKFVLKMILNVAIMAGLISVIRWGGQYFYIYAWFFVLIVSLIFVFLYHDFIAPCFDKYTPLPDGPLKEAIERLATGLQFPLKKLLVVEGSKRSAHSNAYFYGFWKNKCIVLFDTLVEEGVLAPKPTTPTKDGATPTEEDVPAKGETKARAEGEEDGKKKEKGCNTAEVLGVLAHELGHWKLSHNIKNLVISEFNLLFILFLFAFLMEQQDMYTSFGFPTSRPVLIGLILFLQLVLLPYLEVFSFLFTQLTRRFEFQADAFAVSLGHAQPLGSALIKLNQDNLSFPLADPLYSVFHHSHPTLLQRLEALDDKKIK